MYASKCFQNGTNMQHKYLFIMYNFCSRKRYLGTLKHRRNTLQRTPLLLNIYIFEMFTFESIFLSNSCKIFFEMYVQFQALCMCLISLENVCDYFEFILGRHYRVAERNPNKIPCSWFLLELKSLLGRQCVQIG